MEKTINVVDTGAVMRKVYGKMCLALLLTAAASFVVLNIPALLTFFMSKPIIFWGLFAIELILVIYISWKMEDISRQKASMLFYLYSIVSGITLTPVLLVYTKASLALAFMITAGMFAVMTIIGYTTKKDLTGWGTYLMMALIGLIICLLVQLVWHNPMFEFLVSCAAVLIFVGLTAYDTQSIKKSAEADLYGDTDKVATFGALSLYLDFINLFLHILRLIGDSK